jgi:rod shape-determining protein MreB
VRSYIATSTEGGPDVAVDLGTANTLVYVRGRGIVLFEPSVVAIDQRTDEVVAVGTEAKRMLGRTPAYIVATRPLSDGRIRDVGIAQQLLRHFLQRAHSVRWGRPRVVVCVPSGLTSLERAAVVEATFQAGARATALIEEPMAAAIGAGMPVKEATASLVVDVGGGTTEVALIALGGVVVGRSVRVGGDLLDEVIAGYVRQRYGFAVGTQTAEQIKMQAGSAHPSSPPSSSEVRGRDIADGKGRTIMLGSDELRPILEPVLAQISAVVAETLEQTPPELAADLTERGLTLAGGGALLPGLDARIAAETFLRVEVAPDPLTSVALGAGLALEHGLAIDASPSRISRRRRGLRPGRRGLIA